MEPIIKRFKSRETETEVESSVVPFIKTFVSREYVPDVIQSNETTQSTTQSTIKQFKSRPVEEVNVPQIKARPIFANVTVSTTISEDEENKIAELLVRIGFTDFTLTVAEKTRLLALTRDIQITNHQYITEYGSDIGVERIMSEIDKLFQDQTMSKVQDLIAGIMSDISSVDLKHLNNVGGLFNVFKKKFTKEDFIDLLKKIELELCKINHILDVLKQKLPSINQDAEEISAQYRMLSLYIIAGQKRIEQENGKIALEQTSTDFFKQQQTMDMKQAIDRFQRKIESLIKIRTVVMLRFTQFRLEFNNILSTVDLMVEVTQLIIPTWKQQMMLLFSNKGIDYNRSILNDVEQTQQHLLSTLRKSSGV